MCWVLDVGQLCTSDSNRPALVIKPQHAESSPHSHHQLPPNCHTQAVDPALGGNAAATLDEVVSRVARQKSVYKGYGSAREAVLLYGRFILQQLTAVEEARRGGAAAAGKDKGKGAAGATEWAFYKGLEAEVRARIGSGGVGLPALAHRTMCRL